MPKIIEQWLLFEPHVSVIAVCAMFSLAWKAVKDLREN
jgi:hypothetical protein